MDEEEHVSLKEVEMNDVPKDYTAMPSCKAPKVGLSIAFKVR